MRDTTLELLNTIGEYKDFLSTSYAEDRIDKNNYIAEDLKNGITMVADDVYGILTEKERKLLGFILQEEPIIVKDLIDLLHDWLEETKQDIENVSKHLVILDRDFESMMITVERCTEETLFSRLVKILNKFAEEMPSNFAKLINIYSDFSHLWGDFNPEAGNYDHFINGIRAVKEHVDDIRWLYDVVQDYRSKKMIYGLVKFWLELDFGYKNMIKEGCFDDYFDLDVFRGRVSEQEVFVDCGAYTGDTAIAFYNNYEKCKTMYLYDMKPVNLEKAKEKLEHHSEIIYRVAGVGSCEQSGTIITLQNTETSTFSLTGYDTAVDPEAKGIDADELNVEIVAIDDDIKEKISFLKMDIEGYEVNAIMGARKHILNDHPKLAICLYHHYEHLWEIPKLIHSITPDYKFYLRYNGDINGVMASEYVLLAV